MREEKEFHISRNEGKGEIDLPSSLAGPLEEAGFEEEGMRGSPHQIHGAGNGPAPQELEQNRL